jgi:hypothetical protein
MKWLTRLFRVLAGLLIGATVHEIGCPNQHIALLGHEVFGLHATTRALAEASRGLSERLLDELLAAIVTTKSRICGYVVTREARSRFETSPQKASG